MSFNTNIAQDLLIKCCQEIALKHKFITVIWLCGQMPTERCLYIFITSISLDLSSLHEWNLCWVLIPTLTFLLFFLRMFNHISFVGLINGHPGVFLCCEIYTVVRVDSSHCLRIKFIYSIGRKRAFINVDGGITYEDSHL